MVKVMLFFHWDCYVSIACQPIVPLEPTGIAELLELLIIIFPQDVKSPLKSGANLQENELKNEEKHIIDYMI